jgi:hypothetical protein
MRQTTGMPIVQSMSQDRANAPAPVAADPAGLRTARAQHRTVVSWVRSISPVLVVVIVVTAIRDHPGPGITGRGLVVSLATAGIAVGLSGGLWGAMRPAHRIVAVCGGVLLASSAALMWAQPSGPGAASALVGVLFIARILPLRAGVALSATGLAVLVAIVEITSHGTGIGMLVALAGLMGMIFLADRLAQVNDQAARLLAELQASRAAEARAAGLAERQRLAREMHDVLAHSLSGLLLKLEGARMLAARAIPGCRKRSTKRITWPGPAWSRRGGRSARCAVSRCPARTGCPSWPRDSGRTGASPAGSRCRAPNTGWARTRGSRCTGWRKRP